MHVCQIILIEADSPTEAFNNVATILSDGEPSWSDWHNADYSNVSQLDFSGRWSGTVFNTPNAKGEFENLYTTPNYLRYSDDPALADKVIDEYLQERMRSIADYQEELRSFDITSYEYDPLKTTLSMELWRTKKLAQILNDEWTPDSGIYDLNSWSASLLYFTKQVAKDPAKQFLIPVDFHF